MGDVDRWSGGEILKKLEYAGVVEPYATKELSVLHGVHDVLRQTLAGRADPSNATDAGDSVHFKPAYHRHYAGFMRDLRESMSAYRIKDKKFIEARKIVSDILGWLDEECETIKREDPVTFFKRQYKSCPLPKKLNDQDLIKLNKATSNVHRVWETKLAKSIKGTKMGKSQKPEQCMIVQSKKDKTTPKWATTFCKSSAWDTNPDLSALVLACKDSGAILMRRLDVSAGENEGLHTTQILINPKQIKIKPNVDDHEDEYKQALKKLKPKYDEDETYHNVNATIGYKTKKSLVEKVEHLGNEIDRIIRPNQGQPMRDYALR